MGEFLSTLRKFLIKKRQFTRKEARASAADGQLIKDILMDWTCKFHAENTICL